MPRSIARRLREIVSLLHCAELSFTSHGEKRPYVLARATLSCSCPGLGRLSPIYGARNATHKTQTRGVTGVMTKSTLRFSSAVLAIFWSTAAIAQDYRGSADQRAACTPDAFRLCAIYIPDATKVEMCLRTRQSDLSAACRSIFSQNSGSVVGVNQ